MNKRIRLAVLGALSLSLGACTTAGIRQVNSDIDRSSGEARQAQGVLREQAQPEPALRVNRGAYLGSAQPLALPKKDTLPRLFSRKVVYASSGGTLAEQAGDLSDDFGVRVVVRDNLGSGSTEDSSSSSSTSTAASIDQLLSLNYSGSLSGLLDTLADRYRVSWAWRDGRVVFYRWQTETLPIAAFSGKLATNFKLENQSVSSSTDQKVEVDGDFKVYDEILEGAKALLSDNGKASISRAAGALVVTDTPDVIERMREYVRQQNAILSRQVAVSVRVYLLSNTHDEGGGISLSTIFNSSRLNFSSLGATSSGINGSSSLSAGILSGPFSGTKVVVDALKRLGDVSLVTSASGVTLNNQPLPLQNLKTTGYLASASTTTTTNAGTTSGLQPGSVSTGFAMTLTPHVMPRNTILMSYNLSLSSMDKLSTITSGGQSIQTPDTSSVRSMQRVAMRSGSTLVLAGFQQERNQADDTKGLTSVSKYGQSERNLMVITISVSELGEGARG